MKVARYSELNDPFELMASDLSNKDIRRAVNNLKNTFNNKRGLLCFSKSWHNPVIWSHYANKHKGIALGFDIKEEYVAPIKYRKSRLPVKFKKNNLSGGLDSSFVHDLLHTKYIHWKYENEIRLHVDLTTCKSVKDLYFTSFEKVGLELKEVILGHSCSTTLSNTKNIVRKKYKNINIFKARLAFTKYEVVINKKQL